MFNRKINVRKLYKAVDYKAVIDNGIVVVNNSNEWSACAHIQIYINGILVVVFTIEESLILCYESVYNHKIPKNIVKLINDWSKKEIKNKRIKQKMLEYENTLKKEEAIKKEEEILNKFYQKHNFERAVSKAIAKDWEAVGNDMRKYIK